MVTIRNHCCDVCIAGAGPAGLAAAIALRQRGADVLLADALRPPIDKPCGEGLMPEARRALADLGVQIESHHGVAFTGITFASRATQVTADFPGGPGLGIRRTTLHQLLFERAGALGVRFVFNAPVVVKEGHALTLDGQAVAARWIIGADGASSRIRSWAGLDAGRIRSRRFGFRAHYRLAPGSAPPPHVEVHWGPLGQAYLTPIATTDGCAEICVSAMTRHPHLRLAPILDSLPSLRSRIHDAEPVSAERGCLTLTRRLRRVTRGNVALIGDASGSVDAITGEGLVLAFRQALLLADSLAAGSLALYESRHPSLLALPQRMASLLLLLDRHPRVGARTLRAFASRPALFRSLLAVHTGQQPLRHFILRHGLALGSSLLAAPAAQPRSASWINESVAPLPD